MGEHPDAKPIRSTSSLKTGGFSKKDHNNNSYSGGGGTVASSMPNRSINRKVDDKTPLLVDIERGFENGKK